MIEKVIKTVSNFCIKRINDGECEYIRIEDATGGWSLQYREDVAMFGNILSICGYDDEIIEAYLERLLVSFYAHTTHCHDWNVLCSGGIVQKDKKNRPIKDAGGKTEVDYVPFLNEYWKLIDKAFERELSLERKPTKQEEEKALEEEVRNANLLDDIVALSETNDGTGTEETKE